MSRSAKSIMIIPPAHLADRIVAEAMKAHLEARFPGYSFAIDTMSSMPGDYYCFVDLTKTDGPRPEEEDFAKILAVLRAYGDGRSALH